MARYRFWIDRGDDVSHLVDPPRFLIAEREDCQPPEPIRAIVPIPHFSNSSLNLTGGVS